MAGKRTWFSHTCWFCGRKSREVDLIVGDGVYQCHFESWGACQERHDRLDPVAFARLPKPFSDSTRDWTPQARARRAELEQMLAARAPSA